MTSRAFFQIRQVAFNTRAFDAILALRSEAYGRAEAGMPDEVDAYSYHLVAISSDAHVDFRRPTDLLIGACRLTLRKHGMLESEGHYPRWILDEFGSLIGAGSRMCVRPDFGASSHVAPSLLAAAWSLALNEGIRIDVSKARLKAIPYYLRMGYFFVRNSAFSFERWDTRCGLIALPANGAHKSLMSATFATLSEPCPLSAFSCAARFTRSLHQFRDDVNKGGASHQEFSRAAIGRENADMTDSPAAHV